MIKKGDKVKVTAPWSEFRGAVREVVDIREKLGIRQVQLIIGGRGYWFSEPEVEKIEEKKEVGIRTEIKKEEQLGELLRSEFKRALWVAKEHRGVKIPVLLSECQEILGGIRYNYQKLRSDFLEEFVNNCEHPEKEREIAKLFIEELWGR